jgi:hypothetical protein
MNKKTGVMTIDPSGKGTTGICLIRDGVINFLEYQSNN